MPVLLLNADIKKMTIEAIDYVYVQTLADWELIVVMHGGKFFDFRIEFPRIKILEIKKKMGIAEAYNSGFKQANGDIFCCMHNDVRIPFGWNYLLERVARRGDIGFPMVDEENGIPSNYTVQHTPKWQPPGCCFALSKNFWNDLGGFDENFKELHGEDIDLFKRAEKRGAKLVRCDMTIFHYRGATRKLLQDGGNSSLIKNIKRFCLKHSDIEKRAYLPKINEFPEERIYNE
jgi:GT2 family glycosyltransferase